MDIENYEMYNAPKPKDIDIEQGGNVEYVRWGDMIKVVRKKFIYNSRNP